MTMNPESVQRLLGTVDSADDRTCALVLAANLDNRLRELLIAHFLPVDGSKKEEIFEGNGPLSTFSSRITVANLCGLLSEAEHHDLNLIRKIRNFFAHEEENLNFASQKISSRCKSLRLGQELHADHPNSDDGNIKGLFRLVAFSLTFLLRDRATRARLLGTKQPYPHSPILPKPKRD
ncbi:MltR family transcriptional regulator [Variovorax sp. 38R]|uniref:MltR family transcriptional regulator n=1 Tax=Variovorax sp. 38R TaxID=2774875 RepID=UPI00177E3D9F|nr:MltR family transcriptional regulator [Variovorax sp. 38R]QOF76074.1 hypothetical protein IG196_16820 [Variovorax sp. 38R]